MRPSCAVYMSAEQERALSSCFRPLRAPGLALLQLAELQSAHDSAKTTTNAVAWILDRLASDVLESFSANYVAATAAGVVAGLLVSDRLIPETADAAIRDIHSVVNLICLQRNIDPDPSSVALG